MRPDLVAACMLFKGVSNLVTAMDERSAPKADNGLNRRESNRSFFHGQDFSSFMVANHGTTNR